MLEFDGVDISDDVKEALNKQVEAKLANTVSKDEFDKVLQNRDELLTEKKTAQQKAQEAAQEAEEAKRQSALKNSDVESLNKSWQEKYDSLLSSHEEMLNQNKSNTINGEAQKFVDQHVVDDAFSRDAMRAEIAKRLDIRDGNTVVLDAAGNLTALSVQDLYKEFLSADKYKSHIVANKATGGGANGGQNGDGGGAGIPKSLADCKNRADEVKYFNAQLGVN